MSRSASLRGVAWLPLCALLACGGPGGGLIGSGEPEASPFPSRERLEDLAQEPLPERLLGTRIVEVDEWQLAGPLPEQVGDAPIVAPSPAEALLLEAARRKAGLVVVSEALRCAARELARFQLEHDAYPAEDLRRFLFGRCGTSVVTATIAHIEADVPEGAAEDAVLEAWSEPADGLLREALGSGARAVGVAYAARGGRGVLLTVSGERRVHVEPFSPLPDAEGLMRFEGELLGRESELSGLVNRGAYAVGSCQADPALRLPRFRLSCEPDPSDPSAWLSLVARPGGRLLSEVVMDVLVRPSGEPLETFRRSRSSARREVADRADFTRALTVELNRIRAQGRLAPLTLDPGESEVAERLVGAFFASHLGELDPLVADTVALGVMAGWDVDGIVRQSHFGGTLVLQTRDLSRWLTQALSQPLVRSTLLDPEASRMALGALVPEGEAYLGAIVGTYALFHQLDYRAERDALYERIRAEFASRELPTPRVAQQVEAFASDMGSLVRAGQVVPDEALRRILDYAGAVLHADVRGWKIETADLGDLPLPDDLYRGTTTRMAAALDHYRPEEGAWGRYVVLLIAAADSPLRSAALP